MKKLFKYPLVIVFILFLACVTFADFVNPVKEYSETENRVLNKAPVLSLSSLVSNQYTKNYESYVNDQFVMKDSWISLKSTAEKILGKTENNGIVFCKSGYLVPRLYPEYMVETRSNGAGFGDNGSQNASLDTVTSERLSKNEGYIIDFSASTGMSTTVCIVPNVYEIMTEILPYGLENQAQEELICQSYENLEKAGISCVDAYKPLNEAAGDKLQVFYRTDHHWTTDASYYLYRQYARSKALKYIELEDLADKKHEESGFFGTSFSKAKDLSAVPDTLVWYDIPVKSISINGSDKFTDDKGMSYILDGMYQKDRFSTRDKYSAFMWGNNGLTVIGSDHNLNHTDDHLSRVMVIKDSYANCMIPFLTYTYDEIWVIDLRSIPKSVEEMVKETAFDDILILYNFTSFGQSKDFVRIMG